MKIFWQNFENAYCLNVYNIKMYNLNTKEKPDCTTIDEPKKKISSFSLNVSKIVRYNMHADLFEDFNAAPLTLVYTQSCKIVLTKQTFEELLDTQKTGNSAPIFRYDFLHF